MTDANYPELSLTIAIATYNSATRMPSLKATIDQQMEHLRDFKTEVKVFDGGSTDETALIVERYGWEFTHNPRGDAIYAKHLALTKSQSTYICFLDHDEFFDNPRDISNRLNIMATNNNVTSSLSAGYVVQNSEPTSNMYASEFGDPLSCFVYRTSSLSGFRASCFKKKLAVFSEDSENIIFHCSKAVSPILCELVACGAIVNRQYLLKKFPELLASVDLVPHLYYLLSGSTDDNLILISKLDGISHSTAGSWIQIKNKIKWRIQNRWDAKSTISEAGHKGRSKLIDRTSNSTITKSVQFRTLMFVPYTILVIPVLLDALGMAVSRKRVAYLMHVPLSFYVLLFSAKTLVLNLISKNQRSIRYDGSTRNDPN